MLTAIATRPTEHRALPFDEDGNPIPQDGFTTPEQGAATPVWAATSPQLAGRGGVYLDDCDIAELAPAYDEHTSIMDRTGVNEWAVDPERAARLWTLSAELTGVNAFSGFPRSRCPAAQAEDSPRRRPSTRTSTRSVGTGGGRSRGAPIGVVHW